MSFRDLARSSDPESRRSFLRGLAASCLGLASYPLIASPALAAARDLAAFGARSPAPTATARSVIYLYMSGGMSHLDTFDLKPGAETQGPTLPLKTAVDDLFISSQFENLAGLMDRVAVINGMFSSQGAHLQGRYKLHTGYDLRGTIAHPSLGAWLQKLGGRLNPNLPAHVAINPELHTASAGFFPSEYAPLPIGDPEQGLAHAHRPESVSDAAYQRRLARLARMNAAFRE